MLTLFALSMAFTSCSDLSQGAQDLTDFCTSVGKKCTGETAASCVNKLGGKNTTLKSNPDYAGAKGCVDNLSSCDKLPDSCWLFAVESFQAPSEQSNNQESTSDGGAGE